MVAITSALLVCGLALVSAFPADPVLSIPNPEELRYQYLRDDDGVPHLVDQWMKLSDAKKRMTYNSDNTNAYHLFTRNNPTLSQPLVNNNLQTTNFRANRRTIMIIHGFLGSATSEVNSVLVHAFLAAEDVNVIVLDWSAGSYWGPNAGPAGEAAARFINWLNTATGANPVNYHIVGFSVGAHGAAITARNINGNVGYVTGLDPAIRWDEATQFRPNDGLYTEVIHTSAGNIGMQEALAHVDFYPNEGRVMPGCITGTCDHDRSFHYMGESLISGGFTGIGCNSVGEARLGTCNRPERLNLGGIRPKTGSTGIYWLQTNARSPFSRG